MDELTEVVDSFGAALSEPDGSKRATLLERCFADDGVFAAPPTGVVQGRNRLNATLDLLHSHMPGPQASRTTGVDHHHGRFRFQWKVFGPDGGVMFERMDVMGELDDDGRIARATVFMGPPPAKEER